MAWHIIHGLLDQVRIHSTFPGKLWIIMMFIFRILVVARIGDNVYHDEQSQFICNTLTPGCQNVCFNRFRPISQLRFWSLMVLVVSTPGILFCIYASHKIYHACVKFPMSDDEPPTKTWDSGSEPTYIHPPPKRMRSSPPYNNATAPPLYVVKKLDSKKNDISERQKIDRKAARRRYRGHGYDEDKDLMEKRKGSTTDNNCTSVDDVKAPKRWNYPNNGFQNGYPIYSDAKGRRVEYIKRGKHRHTEDVMERKQNKIMLENPQLYRAYWWHVVLRTMLEVGFLLAQYWLYGWFVPELFECARDPCPQVVNCYVSRPMEKSCLNLLMFGLGSISCVLSIGEFYTLGWERFLYALCCRGHKMTYEEKRVRLSRLQNQANAGKKNDGPSDEIVTLHGRAFQSRLSIDSLSSATTVESV